MLLQTLEVFRMAKMTKTQVKNMLNAIRMKSFKLLGAIGPYDAILTVADYTAIDKIIKRALNRVK